MVPTVERAGRWLRVSRAEQDEQSQVPDVDHWIDSHGYELAATYTIRGKSAYSGNRRFDETWAKVLADIRSGEIDVLVVWKTDRLDRKLRTFQMLAEVVDAGGRVEFVTQPHLNDLTTMGGRIALKVQEEIAHEESRIKSDRILAKHKRLRDAGSLVGRPCFGFVIRESGTPSIKVLVPDPKLAPIIGEAVRRYLEGASLLRICEYLTAQGIKPPQAAKAQKGTKGAAGIWRPPTVGHIFRNESLAGRRIGASGRTAQRHEGIIDRQTWDALQREMDRRQGRRGTTTSGTALLTGLVVCGQCGGPLYRHGSEPYRYWRCYGTDTKPSTCKLMVRMGELDQWLDGQISNHGGHVIEIVEIDGENYDDEIADIKRDLADAVAAEEWDKLGPLRTELERLRSLPAGKSRMTGRVAAYTVGMLWAKLDAGGRRRYLLDANVRVVVTKAEFRIEGDLEKVAANGWPGLDGDETDAPTLSADDAVAVLESAVKHAKRGVGRMTKLA
jgi:DNA invertase Pin-like site-specific DNA recombinase